MTFCPLGRSNGVRVYIILCRTHEHSFLQETVINLASSNAEAHEKHPFEGIHFVNRS